MDKQHKLDHVYMKMAMAMATLSHGIRGKVGAVGLTKHNCVLTGVNGLPTMLGNVLEVESLGVVNLDEIDQNDLSLYNPVTHTYMIPKPPMKLVTKVETIHAELNVILKAALEGVSTQGSTIYVTLSPCPHCASMLAAAGVKRVVYLQDYRITTGIDILKQCGIVVEKLDFRMVEYDQ